MMITKRKEYLCLPKKSFEAIMLSLNLDKHPGYKASFPCCALIFNVSLAIEKPKKISKLS
ncbi:hypothetical protein AHAS_Ahas15G0130200 [Arachis hypogaea]